VSIRQRACAPASPPAPAGCPLEGYGRNVACNHLRMEQAPSRPKGGVRCRYRKS
jgi:hypothetical protein